VLPRKPLWRANVERFLGLALGPADSDLFEANVDAKERREWLRALIAALPTRDIRDDFVPDLWTWDSRGPQQIRDKQCQRAQARIAEEIDAIRERLATLQPGERPEPALPAASWEELGRVIAPVISVLDYERVRAAYGAVNSVNVGGLAEDGERRTWLPSALEVWPPRPKVFGRIHRDELETLLARAAGSIR
jgi:hypothetical protein